jgi:hypothetical protein
MFDVEVELGANKKLKSFVVAGNFAEEMLDIAISRGMTTREKENGNGEYTR